MSLPNALTREEIIRWLHEKNEEKLHQLWQWADEIRTSVVGDEVHLRGLIEISNHCSRRCSYCGINAGNTSLVRYRMEKQEIMDCVDMAQKFGYGTVVIQGGEDYGIKKEWMDDIIRDIKSRTDLAVTLSLGERPIDDLEMWRAAGANRYLLRFETSDRTLYEKIHPSMKSTIFDRVEMLRTLRNIGYEIGGGIMVGIPGQTYVSVYNDLCTFQEMDLDMIGVGPYLPHPHTPLGTEGEEIRKQTPDQIANTELMTCKVVALTRILCPEANIPSTTALGTIDRQLGRVHGLQRGANVLMPNITPLHYRKLYEIYPEKAGNDSTPAETDQLLKELIAGLGRRRGKGPGGRLHTPHRSEEDSRGLPGIHKRMRGRTLIT
ncbi:MAG: [FeFe] hydrogenase H-cluster radical SAM maturase HydE [Deltaproteobacteria bacterium]|nr:[FeFe] hydrogenase H-cluster radical SAM maturase HydE [Deltaproteobacteria bacterium]